MTRIPREYTVQDHLDTAKSFSYNISSNPEEAARRQSLRGRGANIINDQSAGLEVGRLTLERLEDPELQVRWARLYGGAVLNSALYLFREVHPQTMSRHLKLPRVISEENLRNNENILEDGDEYDARTLRLLVDVQNESETYESIVEASRNATSLMTRSLATGLGNSAMRLGIYGADITLGENAAETMRQVLDLEIEMHDATKALGRELKTTPSVAQLRSESTPLSAHVIRTSPFTVVQAFRKSLGEVSDELGY